jgi:penicillin-binding protein 1B
MKETGALTAAQYDQYTRVPIEVKPPEKKSNQAPYFLTFVKRQLRDQFSSKSLHTADYKIISTLDYDMQIAAQEALTEGLARIERMRGRAKKPIQGSLIAIEPSTGKIRAFVGGRSFVKSQFDRVTQAHRQPGSSFKPFVYAAALESAFESGTRYYTPATLVIDEPWSVQINKAVWEPKNYNGQYNGVVTLRTALAKSMNIATARIAYDIGLDKITEVAQRMGFTNVKPYPSMALGSFEVTPYELARAYSALANGGKMVELQSIERVAHSKGEILRNQQPQSYAVLHEQTAYLITDMLKTVMTSGTAASIQQYGLRQHFAGKTGTTNDFKDAWFVGYSPDLICLVWVGYDDNTPVKMTGAQAALPIWARFMQKIQSRLTTKDFQRPAGIVEKWIDPYTGKLASEECGSSVRELFIAGTEPFESCTLQDYALPIENFAGPEPGTQQTGVYTNSSPGNITFDRHSYTYTNYNNEDSDNEMIDYSDQDFYESEDNSTSTIENDSTHQGDENQELEDGYHSSVLNDYEAVRAPYDSAPQDEAAGQENTKTNSYQISPSYMAPPTNAGRKHVYTNEDIQQTQTTEADPD